MGVCCYIDAPSDILERIAGITPGGVAEIMAAEADRQTHTRTLKLAATQIGFLDCYTLQNAEQTLHHAMWDRVRAVPTLDELGDPGVIDTSFIVGPKICLQTFTGWNLAEGLPNCGEHGGGSQDPATMATIIGNQGAQRYDGLDPEDLEPECAHDLRRYRAACNRALTEIGAGNVRSVFWG